MQLAQKLLRSYAATRRRDEGLAFFPENKNNKIMNSNKGAFLIELAILLSFLIILLSGVITFGIFLRDTLLLNEVAAIVAKVIVKKADPGMENPPSLQILEEQAQELSNSLLSDKNQFKGAVSVKIEEYPCSNPVDNVCPTQDLESLLTEPSTIDPEPISPRPVSRMRVTLSASNSGTSFSQFKLPEVQASSVFILYNCFARGLPSESEESNLFCFSEH